MPELPEDTNPKTWHRYFAVECNNLAWQLAVQERTPAQDHAMLNAAHAAAFHWNEVGTELHHVRAKMLLAEVHALLGLGFSALAYAEEVSSYLLAIDTPDWELAFVHTIHAHAACVVGDSDKHRTSYQAAQEAIAAISDDQDREIVLETFERVPAPTPRR